MFIFFGTKIEIIFEICKCFEVFLQKKVYLCKKIQQ